MMPPMCRRSFAVGEAGVEREGEDLGEGGVARDGVAAGPAGDDGLVDRKRQRRQHPLVVDVEGQIKHG